VAKTTHSKPKPSDTREKLLPMLRIGGVGLAALVLIYIVASANFFPMIVKGDTPGTATTTPPTAPPFDKVAYDTKMLTIANAPTSTWTAYLNATSTNPNLSLPTIASSIKAALSTSTLKTLNKLVWPVQNLPYPLPGALLPNNRIVAYYGNFYSTAMGVLGQTPPSVMIPKLKAAVAEWQAADPSTPVIPAIDYIDITAQGSAGKDGMYRARMPDSQIDIALDLAKQVNGIVILDIQVGLSNLPTELPLLEKYLSMPNVHLAIDPEFAMHNGAKPGTVVGTYSAADINWAANYLAGLVQKNHLPPKILIVHRFTQGMVTGSANIKPLPEVQVVMDMDGWGSATRKIGTYQAYEQNAPVQFTGFKLFYKNDLKAPSTALMTPAQVLKLTPQPMFIQYQ
jgi:hypothetical protein